AVNPHRIRRSDARLSASTSGDVSAIRVRGFPVRVICGRVERRRRRRTAGWRVLDGEGVVAESTMMDVPLQIRRLLDHGAGLHGGSRIVTATDEGPRSVTFAETGERAARLAGALQALGISPGDRVATFMWNNAEHVEAYLAVPSMGAVVHPLNIRLFP